MLFHVFSNPAEGDFLALAGQLSCRLFRSTVGAVSALAGRVGAAPPQIDADSATPDRVSTRLWSTDVGNVLRGLSERTGDHRPWVSAQLAIAAFTSGVVDDIDLELAGAADRWLAVAGRSLRGERLRVEGRADRLVVTGSPGETLLRLDRVGTEGLDPVWTRSGADDLVRIGSAGMAVVSGGECIDQWETPEFELAPATPAFRALIEEAAALLEECLPATYVWIAAVLREVGALAPRDGVITSSSSVKCPGHVRMSSGASLIQTINMLVHECCHQYFYLAATGSRIVRRGAPQVFARPFERVLLGFHAYGNVLLVDDALLDGRHPVDSAEIERERALTRQIVTALDALLQGGGEEHLEETGLELYLPLRRRLVEAKFLDAARSSVRPRRPGRRGDGDGAAVLPDRPQTERPGSPGYPTIPAVCHVCWGLWDDGPMPERFRQAIGLWEAQGWTVRIWQRPDMMELLHQHPDVLAVCQTLPRKVQWADLLRYLIVYEHGGLYSDLDCQPRAGTDLLTFVQNNTNHHAFFFIE